MLNLRRLAAFFLVSAPALAQGTLLLQDDFNDNQLDLSKWTTVLAGGWGASVTEQNQRIELVNAGWLVTAQQFDPVGLHGLRITGRCRYQQWATDFEVVSVTTRTNGVPTDPYNMPQSGIRFLYATTQSTPFIEFFGLSGTQPATSGSIAVSAGDEVAFDIRDEGATVSITVTKVSDPAQSASATATITQDQTTQKRIAWFNRPGNLGYQLSFLDDLEVRGYTNFASTYCVPKTNSQGCIPAIGYSGVPSVTGPDNFLITATNVLNNKTGILLWSQTSANTPFFGGTLCVGGEIRRTPAQNSRGNAPPDDCSGTYSFHFSQPYMVPHLLGGGSTVYAQYWSRDPGFASPNNLGLTNGLHFTIAP